MTLNNVRVDYPPPQPHHAARHRGGSAAELAATWRSATKKARQEICAPLKWFCFTLNVFIFLAGVTCLALGIYLYTKEPRPIAEPVDMALNPAVLITLFGGYVVTLSLCGLFGALRDNVFLLKTFALCVFCGYVALVVATFGVFMLFYSEASGGIGADIHGDGGISATTILNYSIRKYHTNRNVADFVDYIQEQLECCGGGSSAQGFRDWGQLNEQFQCNQTNPYPERCGVPFSCCRKSIVSEQTIAGGSGGAGEAASNALLLPAMRSLQCWQNAQQRRDAAELESDIYTRGCAQPLRAAFDKYALHLGAVVLAIIMPVCFGVCLSQCLARQIDYQRYLLAREARRHERQMRRERRYIEQQQNQQQKARERDNNKAISTIAGNNNSNNKSTLMEQGKMGPGGGKTVVAPLPPAFAPPSAPEVDAEAVRRRQERREQRRLEKQQQQRWGHPEPGGATVVHESHRKTSSSAKPFDDRPMKASNGNYRKTSAGAPTPPMADPTPTPSAPPLSSAYGSTYGVHYGDRQPQPYFLKQSDFS